jgi:hypothetical protein
MTKTYGRPKKTQAEQRTSILRICLTPSERKAVDAAAQADHLDTSVWARVIILRAAEKGLDSPETSHKIE